MANNYHFRFLFVDTCDNKQTTIVSLNKNETELAIATFEKQYKFKWWSDIKKVYPIYDLLFEVRLNYVDKYVWTMNDLLDVIAEYDLGLAETLENKECSEKFGRCSTLLAHFAVCNKTFDYQRYLTKENCHHLSYFYTDKMLNNSNEYTK